MSKRTVLSKQSDWLYSHGNTHWTSWCNYFLIWLPINSIAQSIFHQEEAAHALKRHTWAPLPFISFAQNIFQQYPECIGDDVNNSVFVADNRKPSSTVVLIITVYYANFSWRGKVQKRHIVICCASPPPQCCSHLSLPCVLNVFLRV